MLFTGLKILFLAKVITFWNLEDTGNNSMRVDFNHNFPKITIFEMSKHIFSYIFYPIILKPDLDVLGVN